MIVIADAGGTKTDWRILRENRIDQLQSEGFNFKHSSVNELAKRIPVEVMDSLQPDRVYFYGSGIVSDSDSVLVKKALISIFPSAVIEVSTDILGAARALYGKEKGYVGILGTGAAMAHYNGTVIDKRIPSLGYVLGDEGSGTDLGRSWIRLYLRQQVPVELMKQFEQQFPNSKENEVLHGVYQGNGAARFLAEFVPFLIDHQSHPFVHAIIEDRFAAYLDHFLHEIEPEKTIELKCAGSVAHWLSDVLRRVANSKNIRLVMTAPAPIAGLALYHQNYG